MNLPHEVQGKLSLRKVQFHQQGHAQNTRIKRQRFAWILDAVHGLLEQKVLSKWFPIFVFILTHEYAYDYYNELTLVAASGFLHSSSASALLRPVTSPIFFETYRLIPVGLPKVQFIAKNTRCLAKLRSAVFH